MARHLILSLLLAIVATPEALAQRNLTPGLPWTYIVEDSIPDRAKGPAWDSVEQGIRDVYATLDQRYNEIRHIYRVRFHPGLTTILPGDSIRVEVPRNPGESEIVTLGTATMYRRTTREGDHTFDSGWVIGGFRSNERPELRAATLTFTEGDNTRARPPDQDTFYLAQLKFFPEYFFLQGGVRGGDTDEYGFMIQFVDSVWAPRISSLASDPAVELALRAYPNPASEEVTVDLPDDWATAPLSVRVYGPTGATVARRYCSPGARQSLAVEPTWPSGLYHAAFYRDGGRVAVARFVKP